MTTYDGVTYDVAGIDNDAFNESVALTSISLPSTIRIIKGGAFNSTSGLKSIVLPDGLEELEGAFNGSGIETIDFGNTLKRIHGQCFYGAQLNGDIVLPNSVTSLGYGVFQHTQVKSLELGTGLTEVDAHAFHYMDNLAYVINHSSLDVVDNYGLTCPVYSSIEQNGDFWFASDDEGYILCKYTGTAKALTLPEDHNGSSYRVGKNVFRGNETLTSITIGNGVTEIGDDAFHDCYNVTVLNLGNSVTKIGARAFQTINSGLKSIVVPNSVTEIGYQAFHNCNNVETITLGSGVITIGDDAFGSCHNIQKITIPNSVKELGAYFVSNTQIQEIVLGTGLEDIHPNAFKDVWYDPVIYNYSDIDIANECNLKPEIKVYSNIRNINGLEFANVDGETMLTKYTGKETDIQLPDDINGESYAIADNAFKETGIKSIVFGRNITSVGRQAFQNCDRLVSVKFNDNLNSIGYEAFHQCQALETVTFGKNLEAIGERAFADCGAITTLKLPDSLKTLEYQAFVSLTSLTEISFGNALETIGDNAFYNCGNLRSIVLPASVKTLGQGAFDSCHNLQSIQLNEGLETIGNRAFSCAGCYSEGFKELTIPNSVTTIGDRILCNSQVRIVYIGTGLTDVHRKAFDEAYNLQFIFNKSNVDIANECSVKCPVYDSYLEKDGYLFAKDGTTYSLISYTGTATEIVLPDDIEGESYVISNGVFRGMPITSVTFGNKVTAIGTNAFRDCGNLQTLVVPDAVTKIGASFIANSTVREVTIGTGLTSVDEKIFDEAYNLQYVYNYSDLDLAQYTDRTVYEKPCSIGDYDFAGLHGEQYLIRYNGSDTELTLPDNVNGAAYHIGAEVFLNNKNLKSVIFGANVLSVGDNAFRDLDNLQTVVLNDGLQTIGSEAFCYSDNLQSIVIPNSVKRIESRGIAECRNLRSVTLGNSLEYVGFEAFAYCYSLGSLVIPNSVKRIDNCFLRHSGVNSLVIGNGLETVENNTFEDSYSLRSIYNTSKLDLSQYVNNECKVYNDVTFVGDYLFVENNGENMLAKYIGSDANIVLPESFNGETYVVAERAFSGSNIISVNIGNGVTKIGSSAFRGCEQLKEVTIGKALVVADRDIFEDSNNIETVNYNAVNYNNGFNNIHNIKTLNIGNDVNTIPGQTFCGNPNFTAIVIPDRVKHIGYDAFNGCENLKEVTIGKGLETCEYGVFHDCPIEVVNFNAVDLKLNDMDFYSVFPWNDGNNFIKINLGNDVQRIPKEMFRERRDMAEFTFPASVKYIDDGAFRNCVKLTNIVIPENVEVIGKRAFEDIPVKKLVLSAALDTIGENAFKRHELTEIVIPNGVRYIGDRAFSGDWEKRTLEYLTLGESVEYIGYEAFFHNALRELIIPNSAKVVRARAFCSSEKLTSLTLNNYIDVIEEEAFLGCGQLSEVVIPNSVTEIKRRAFSDCGNLQKVTFGDNISVIGNEAFSYCGNLREVILPESVRTIGDCAFRGIWSMNNIKLNEGLVSIGREAFWDTNCGAIITIPSTVKEIGSNAFNESTYCMSKATTPPTLGNEAFRNNFMQVLVPRGSYEAYAADSQWQQYILMEAGKEFVLKRDDVNGINTLYQAILKNGVPGAEYGKVTIVGLPIEIDDFKYLNTSLPNLMELDMSQAEVDVIPEGAFRNKVLLSSVILPATLTRIEREAFDGCVSLENELVLPENLEYISDYAYRNCISIPSLKMNENLLNIGNGAFENCRSLKGDFVAPFSLENIYSSAFYNCSELTGVEMADAINLRTLGTYAFANCSKLTYVNLPEQLVDIEYGSFENCQNIENVTFPTYVETIGGRAFHNNRSLRVVNLKGTQLRTIGENAFSYCSTLLAVNLQETNLNNIDQQAFQYCGKLTTVNLPDNYCNLHTLGTLAFAYCRSLENITSPGMSPAQCYGADQTNSPFLGVSANKTTFTIPDDDTAYEAYLMANFWGAFISKDTHQEIINESVNGDSKGVIYFYKDDQYDDIMRAPRRAPGAKSINTDVLAELSDASRLFIPNGETISFVINPEKGYKIGTVMFNGEDVTDQVVNNVFTTPAINAGGSMQVSFVETEHVPATSIKLDKSALALPIGATEQLIATVTPAAASDEDILWKSSNTKVATVDADGVVTALAEGTATITASVEGGKLSAMCAVTVTKDNYLVSEPMVETAINSSVDVEVSIVNKNDIYGFQCDIYLPEGVTLDQEAITYSSEISSLPLMYGTSDDGKALRIMRYSDNGKPVAANATERVLFTLPLAIGNIAGGNMQVKIANIKFASENDGIKKYVAPDVTTVLVVNGYAMGDVNQDNTIDVADIVAIGYRTVNKPITTIFNERLADLNYDGDIDISDLALEVKLVLSGANRTPARKPGSNTEEQSEDESTHAFVLSMEDSNLALTLDAPMVYTAFQCNIALPDGMTFAKDARGNAIVTLNGAISDTHRVITNIVDGVLNVAVFSEENILIPAVDASIMNVAIEGNGDFQFGGMITVNDLLFAKLAQDQVVRTEGGFSSLYIDVVTGIETLDAEESLEYIYDLNGRRLNKADKGVYIINKKKVVK